MAAYELWEMRSGNLVGSYPSRDAALNVIADTVRKHGYQAADSVVLTFETGTDSEEVAEGRALADLALKASESSTERTA